MSFRTFPDAARPSASDPAEMGSHTLSYAVLWRTGKDTVAAGGLEIDDHEIRLHGRSRDGASAELTVDRSRIGNLHIGRDTDELIDGRRSLVVERQQQDPLLITDLAIGSGTLLELADTLAPRPGWRETG